MSKKTSLPRRGERGQSLLELGLSFVLVVTVLAGAVSFGMGLFYYVAMRDAAQEGAVYGSLNPNDTAGIGVRVRDAAGGSGLIYNIYTSGDLQVLVGYSGAHCEGNGITVTLTYDFPIFMPFIGTIIGSDHIHLVANVTDTILTPVC